MRTPSAKQEDRWSRPQLDRTRPNRSAGGFYRTAEGGHAELGGVPLTAAQDAVVAAVRMAYSVAAAQVERSTRLAQRLREAGDLAVGARSDRKALDATEQLVFRAMMGALSWLEAAAAEDDSPLRRLMAAQYRLLGSLLGVTLSPGTRTPPQRSPEAAAPHAEAFDTAYASPGRVKVVLQGSHKRPVRTRRCDVGRDTPISTRVQFYSVDHIASDPLAAQFDVDARGIGTIAVEVQRLAPAGLWKAAICDAEDVQIGIIEIEL